MRNRSASNRSRILAACASLRWVRISAQVLAVAAAASSASADEWNNAAGGDWHTGSNWLDGTVPTAGDWAYFQNDLLTTGTVTFSGDAASQGLTLKNTTGTITFAVGDGNKWTQTLFTIMGDGDTPALQKPSMILTSGEIQANLVLIGNNDHTEGHVTVSGPTAIYRATGSIRVGSDSGSNSTMRVENGGQAISQTGMWVGLQTAINCDLTVTDPGSKVTVTGAMQVAGSNEGETEGGHNTVNVLNGGELNVGQLLVGVGNTTASPDNTVTVSGTDSKIILTANAGAAATAASLGFRFSNNILNVENGGALTATAGDFRIGSGTLSSGNVLHLSGGSVTLTGSGDLATNGAGRMDVQRGTFRVSGGVATLPGLLANLDTGVVELTGGTTIVGNASVNNGTTMLVGDGTGSTATYRMSSAAGTHTFANGLHIQSDGRLEGAATIVGNVTNDGIIAPAAAAGTTHIVGTLSINTAAGATVDLADNDLVIDWDATNHTNQASAIGAYIANARNNGGSGSWSGPGITSSMAQADDQYAIGYADNGETGFHLTEFSGRTVDDSAVLVKFTYGGDSNLDGKVDVGDLGNLASNWQQSGVWAAGDFDYNGTINVGDLGILATNWQKGVTNPPPLGPSFAEALAALGLPGVSVPEPGTAAVVLAGIAACGLGRSTRVRRR